MIIISFILESFISRFTNLNTYLFSPLFVLISLIIFYRYNRKKTLMITIIVGIMYDLIFSKLFFINIFIFYIIFLCYNYLKKKININYILTISIILYRLIFYIFLIFINYNIPIYLLIKSIISSIPINFIYYYLLNFSHKLLKH